MTFRVGLRVICIESGLETGTAERAPLLNDIAVIDHVYIAGGDVMIELREFPQPENEEYFSGWEARYFRPIVERKTDISCFTKMLTGTKIGADA